MQKRTLYIAVTVGLCIMLVLASIGILFLYEKVLALEDHMGEMQVQMDEVEDYNHRLQKQINDLYDEIYDFFIPHVTMNMNINKYALLYDAAQKDLI